jgi:hypothetical protein
MAHHHVFGRARILADIIQPELRIRVEGDSQETKDLTASVCKD